MCNISSSSTQNNNGYMVMTYHSTTTSGDCWNKKVLEDIVLTWSNTILLKENKLFIFEKVVSIKISSNENQTSVSVGPWWFQGRDSETSFFLENLKNAKAKRIINKLANMVATYFNIYDI